MNKHDYICKVCDVIRRKSSCIKRKVGAIFINKDFEILATGFNESPKGFPHCDGGETCGDPCKRTIHAEQNAIAQSAKRGVALEGAVLYCTYLPCINCARLLVNIGIKKVYVKAMNTDGGEEILKQAGISLKKWTE